jgi:predicted amidohydrolase
VHDGRLGTLGLATCYDLRFPELFRGLVDRSVVAVSLVASWPERRIAHWRLLAQARAVEDQVYVLACNAVGTHAGVTMGGHSMVVDPWGEVLAEAGTDEQVLTVDVDLSSVAGIRERFRSWATGGSVSRGCRVVLSHRSPAATVAWAADRQRSRRGRSGRQEPHVDQSR